MKRPESDRRSLHILGQSMDNKKCIRCFKVHVLIYLEVRKQLGNSPGSSNGSNFGVRKSESREAEGLFGENNLG
jgi:hypothetical protein